MQKRLVKEDVRVVVCTVRMLVCAAVVNVINRLSYLTMTNQLNFIIISPTYSAQTRILRHLRIHSKDGLYYSSHRQSGCPKNVQVSKLMKSRPGCHRLQ